MQRNGWDHALKVTADGKGLVGHAGAILLRKAADQAGTHRRPEHGTAEDGHVAAAGPGDRAGLDGGGDRARAPPA